MPIVELEKLKELDFKKQVAFAYLACERFYLNYVYFSENYKFGNPKILREAIDFVYSAIFIEGDVDKQKVENFLTLIFNNTPSTTEFPIFYAQIAMYTGGIIYESTNLLKKSDVSRIIKDITTTSTDIIDCFIQERDDMDYNDVDFEAKILNDTIMQKELVIQNGIISYLEKIDNIEPTDVETLIQLQENESRTLIV